MDYRRRILEEVSLIRHFRENAKRQRAKDPRWASYWDRELYVRRCQLVTLQRVLKPTP